MGAAKPCKVVPCVVVLVVGAQDATTRGSIHLQFVCAVCTQVRQALHATCTGGLGGLKYQPTGHMLSGRHASPLHLHTPHTHAPEKHGALHLVHTNVSFPTNKLKTVPPPPPPPVCRTQSPAEAWPGVRADWGRQSPLSRCLDHRPACRWCLVKGVIRQRKAAAGHNVHSA